MTDVGGRRVASRWLIALLIGATAFVVATRILEVSQRRAETRSTGSGHGQPMRPAVMATTYTYEIVREFPHDPTAFTQGLIYHDSFLYESTGPTGHSSLRKVRLETGEVIKQVELKGYYFAEGLTHWAGKLLQLAPLRTGSTGLKDLTNVDFQISTLQRRAGWNVGIIYDLATLEQQSTFGFQGEGWGLTHDGKRLILSDGSARLRFLDPKSLQELGSVTVTDKGVPLINLNELEFVKGEIYANVWQDERIVIIDSKTGQITGNIDMKDLRSRLTPAPNETKGAVLNGIAYDADGDRLFVTGKLWPRVFEIRLKPAA